MKLNEAIKILNEHGYKLDERRSWHETHPAWKMGPARDGNSYSADEKPASDNDVFYDANELFKQIASDFKKRPDTPIKVILNGNKLAKHEEDGYFTPEAKLNNIYRLISYNEAEYGLLSDMTRNELEELAKQYNFELLEWWHAGRFFVQFTVYEAEPKRGFFSRFRRH